MATSLNFAFLARSIHIEEGGAIHALGVGFTHVRVGSLADVIDFAVGLHVWVDEAEPGTPCLITVSRPDGFEMSFRSFLRPLPGEPVLEGRRAISSRLPLVLPLGQEGVHAVEICFGEGTPVHRLAFMVEQVEGRS